MTTDEPVPKKQKLNMPSFKVFLRSAKGKVPTRGSALAAGYDLYSSEKTVIPAGERGLVATDISVVVPEGYYGRVAPRSGLAVKKGIHAGAGVVDADYRGELRVMLFNLSKEDFTVDEGDRIAQIVLEKITTPEVEVLDAAAWEKELNTERGEGGFGSTGKN